MSDQHARLVVGLEAQVGLVQRRRGRAVDGVAAVLAVDRDQRGGAAALVADRLRRRGRARAAVARLSQLARRCYQPPRQLGVARAATSAAALRASLRLSRRVWSMLIAKTNSGKKTIRMKPALVTTLSSVAP